MVAADAFFHRPDFGVRRIFRDDTGDFVETGCSKDNDKFQFPTHINTQTCVVADVSCHEEERCGRTTGRESTYGSRSTAWWKEKGL